MLGRSVFEHCVSYDFNHDNCLLFKQTIKSLKLYVFVVRWRNQITWIQIETWNFRYSYYYYRYLITGIFPHSWLITGFVVRVTRRMSNMEQELLTLPEHMSSTLVFGGVRVTRSLVLCVVFCRKVFVFLSFFLFAIVLSVLLWITSSDYSFGILIFVWSEKHKSAFEQKFPFQSSHLSNLLFVNNQENKLFIPLWV